jgi:hypothetical protein
MCSPVMFVIEQKAVTVIHIIPLACYYCCIDRLEVRGKHLFLILQLFVHWHSDVKVLCEISSSHGGEYQYHPGLSRPF